MHRNRLSDPLRLRGVAKKTHDDRHQAAIAALRDGRKRLCLSQTELGVRLGQRQQFVSKYESGERHLDVIEFVDVATALNLDWVGLVRENTSGG